MSWKSSLATSEFLQHPHQRLLVPDEGLEYGVQVLIFVQCYLENAPGRMGPVHEHKLEIGQRSDQVLLVGIGVAPSTQGLGPQQVTCHLLVSGAISDKHLSYGSHVGPEAGVQFWHDTRMV